MEALSAAQRLAFAPLAFHATVVLRDRGLLAALAKADPDRGMSIDEAAAATGMSQYAARVLLEAGLGLRIVWRRDGTFRLGRLGHILLGDEMTRVNLDFGRDICERAAAHLDEALCTGIPSGLRELGPWSTLYEGLSILPEPARSSWHAFDHFYSDVAFRSVCARLAANPPARMLDIGCNTGKWAHLCLAQMPELQIGLVDLPEQLDQAWHRLAASGLNRRAFLHPTNLLDPACKLPNGYELVWMSQLLDCFSDAQIVEILSRVRAALPSDGRVWILELFWDRQRFEAAAFSLQMTSLYFTCVANGNSQMYDSSVFLPLIQRAGLEICAVTDGIGNFHTLVECRIAQ